MGDSFVTKAPGVEVNPIPVVGKLRDPEVPVTWTMPVLSSAMALPVSAPVPPR